MSEQERADEPRPASDQMNTVANDGASAPIRLQPDKETKTSAVGETVPSKKLTPEEQMALYEKDLKENDWGHQPC